MSLQYANLSDEELMAVFQKGDANSFEVLLARHKKGVYNFIYHFIHGVTNTEEAFQEVFERVIRSAHAYTPQAKFSTWLYTIARNYCIDFHRKQKIRKGGHLEDWGRDDDGGGGGWEEIVTDDKPRIDQEVGAMDLAQKLEAALSVINADQKEVFLLREKQGLQFEEIAEIMGVSVNTVKSRMRYALKALQEEFKKWGITEL